MARVNQINDLTVSVAISAGAANTTTATISVLRNGVIVPGVFPIEAFISRSATGQGLTATAASGALTATTGAILTALTAKKHVLGVTDLTGLLVLSLVDTAKTAGEYFCAFTPGGNTPIVVAGPTVTASYGA